MSGHSKWAQIKRQKGVADIKRGQAFTKISNAITIAVKQGGGATDPGQNFRLRLAIEKARGLNMPRENIERAIQRASGKQAGEIEEVVYEGFAPFGVSVIIEAATDNKQRTASEIKNVFDKAGGTLAQPGAVSYQFQPTGKIMLKKESHTLDDVFLSAAESGAEDVGEMGDTFIVYTKASDLTKVSEALSAKEFSVIQTELSKRPISPVVIGEAEKLAKIRSFIAKLEEMDDVQKVYSNFGV
ncbi:MAG: YebC/PmpR family DNA-binding transcriptional regulator [Candidatus Levybacteria bacterium]|nr:YebC/PmpR family DNA-binding transcriptional regulator [Candidatus Levybacteria bacterium]